MRLEVPHGLTKLSLWEHLLPEHYTPSFWLRGLLSSVDALILILCFSITVLLITSFVVICDFYYYLYNSYCHEDGHRE